MRTIADVMYETRMAAGLLAAEMVRLIYPAKDAITKREAYRRYNKKWIDDNTENGLLNPVRKGTAPNSPVIYSVAEIVALQESEKQVVAAVKEIIKNRTNKE